MNNIEDLKAKAIVIKELQLNGYQVIDINANIESNISYSSCVIFCNLITKNGSDEKNQNLVLKLAPNDNVARRCNPITVFFIREIFFYDNIITKFIEIQEKFRIEQSARLKFPKCYGTSSQEEYLILENLTNHGYVSKQVCDDYKYVSLALKTIAKVHALSFIYESTEPEAFRNVTKHLTDIFMNKSYEYDPAGAKHYGEAILQKMLRCVKNKNHKEKLQRATDNLFITITEKRGDGKIRVISHGDYWTSNIFFEYKNGHPVDAIPIDYAFSQYCSIANDILYFMTSPINRDIRTNHFWEAITDYYDSLREFLALYSFDVQEFCTFDQLVDELRSQYMMGLGMSLFVSHLHTTDRHVQHSEIFTENLPEDFYDISEKFSQYINNFLEDYETIDLF